MFKFYNKDVVTELDGDKRIIGVHFDGMCLLKGRNGPLYVGSFVNCEYVAAAINASEKGAKVPLYLDRLYQPCDKAEAIISIEPCMGDYRFDVRYEPDDAKWSATMETILQKLLYQHSPFRVDKIDKTGRVTTDQYTRLIVCDFRTDEEVTISFTHGIRIARRVMLPLNVVRIMAGYGRWPWDKDGRVPYLFSCLYDPDYVLESVYVLGDNTVSFEGYSKELLDHLATLDAEQCKECLATFKQQMLSTYIRARIDRTADVELFIKRLTDSAK